MALPAPGALGYYRPVRVWPGWLRVYGVTTPTHTARRGRREGIAWLAWLAFGLGDGGAGKTNQVGVMHHQLAVVFLNHVVVRDKCLAGL